MLQVLLLIGQHSVREKRKDPGVQVEVLESARPELELPTFIVIAVQSSKKKNHSTFLNLFTDEKNGNNPQTRIVEGEVMRK